MAPNVNDFRRDQGYQGGKPDTTNSFNSGSLHDSINRLNEALLSQDPAFINPDELATFPKQVQPHDHYCTHGHERHLASKRTPARDGSNITRTDNHPDKHGFM